MKTIFILVSIFFKLNCYSETTLIKYDFREMRQLPSNITTYFTDYPRIEDDNKIQNLKKRVLFIENFTNKNNRKPTFDELMNFEINTHGFWLKNNLKSFDNVTPLPIELKSPGLLWSFVNRSDDTNTFIIIKSNKLLPKSKHKIRVRVLLTTNASNCSGVGGSEDAVDYLVNVWPNKIERYIDDLGYWRSKAQLLKDETSNVLNSQPLGSIWNGYDCNSKNKSNYNKAILGENENPAIQTTSDKGELFITLSTHSGFESLSYWSLDRIDIAITPAGEALKNNPFPKLPENDLPKSINKEKGKYIIVLKEGMTEEIQETCIQNIKNVESLEIFDDSLLFMGMLEVTIETNDLQILKDLDCVLEINK